MRRKNPHPKRAVNARTVLKGEKEEPLVLCSRIPDEEDDLEANHHQIQKEEEEEGEDDDVERLRRIMCVPRDDVVEQNQTRKDAKGVKRKRGHECDFCEKVFRYPSQLANTCVRTRKRNLMNVKCARSVLLNLVIWKGTCVFTRTRNRTNVMCARSVSVILVLCKGTSVFTRTRNRTNVMCARSVSSI